MHQLLFDRQITRVVFLPTYQAHCMPGLSHSFQLHNEILPCDEQDAHDLFEWPLHTIICNRNHTTTIRKCIFCLNRSSLLQGTNSNHQNYASFSTERYIPIWQRRSLFMQTDPNAQLGKWIGRLDFSGYFYLYTVPYKSLFSILMKILFINLFMFERKS